MAILVDGTINCSSSIWLRRAGQTQHVRYVTTRGACNDSAASKLKMLIAIKKIKYKKIN